MNYHPLQRLLVPLDTSDYSRCATLRACEIAKSHFAQLSGLAVLDSPSISASTVPGDFGYWPMFGDTLGKLTESARQRITTARDAFSDLCEHHGVCHQQSELEGVAGNRILEASILYDLVVIGLRTCFHFESTQESIGSLAEILGRTVTPVLAVPLEESATAYRKVAVAYDGSFSSGRALRDFVAFSQPYEMEITIVTARNDSAHAQHLIDDASAYLRSHDVEKFDTAAIGSHDLSSSGVPAIEEADLVVAGIHSRHMLRDLFVGSFTQSMIERGDKALFLSH